MKKGSELVLKTTTDIKVFLLFIFDNVGHPIDHSTVLSIVEENTDDISRDHAECLHQLVESGHLIYDEVDGEGYYMISDKGHLVAAELYDSLDASFRERGLRCAIKHISLSGKGTRTEAYITETECKRFRVTLEAYDRLGQIMSVSVTVSSRAEAEAIRKSYEQKPDGVYRGVLFSVTGRLGYIS